MAMKKAVKKTGASTKAIAAQSLRMTKQAKAAPKSGAGYLKNAENSKKNDRAGTFKFANETYGNSRAASWTPGSGSVTGRTYKRQEDQDARSKKKK